MKRLILTALSFAMVVAAKADIIRGYVVDADTERHWLPPLRKAPARKQRLM